MQRDASRRHLEARRTLRSPSEAAGQRVASVANVNILTAVASVRPAVGSLVRRVRPRGWPRVWVGWPRNSTQREIYPGTPNIRTSIVTQCDVALGPRQPCRTASNNRPLSRCDLDAASAVAYAAVQVLLRSPRRDACYYTPAGQEKPRSLETTRRPPLHA